MGLKCEIFFSKYFKLVWIKGQTSIFKNPCFGFKKANFRILIILTNWYNSLKNVSVQFAIVQEHSGQSAGKIFNPFFSILHFSNRAIIILSDYRTYPLLLQIFLRTIYNYYYFLFKILLLLQIRRFIKHVCTAKCVCYSVASLMQIKMPSFILL